MAETAEKTENRVNGLDMDALAEVIRDVEQNPAHGIVGFKVTSEWKGQTRSEATVASYVLGGERIPRQFKIAVDEPFELLGENTAPNPQEMLMSALNACVMVGYVAGRGGQQHHPRESRDRNHRPVGSARLPRDRRNGGSRIREHSLHGADQGQRNA